MDNVTNVTELKPKKDPVNIDISWGEVALVIAAYTIGCRLFGYRMVKPVRVKDGVIIFRTITGRLLKATVSS